MKLSIIVCVYNTEYSLFDKCLASIRRSSLKSEDYEIVVIDDGSKIDYSELVKKYSLTYTKTENQGIFAARALGISLAKGDYIAFVDSDDSVSFNYHAPMLQLARGEGVDVVFNDLPFSDFPFYRSFFNCHIIFHFLTFRIQYSIIIIFVQTKFVKIF